MVGVLCDPLADEQVEGEIVGPAQHDATVALEQRTDTFNAKKVSADYCSEQNDDIAA